MPAHVVPGLGEPSAVPSTGFRGRIRENPALHAVWRGAVCVAGLCCVAVGCARAVLPGPLTIPPVLLGLWIWSSEFAWAQRLFRGFVRQARAAWQHAKQHPVSSTVITVGGIV